MDIQKIINESEFSVHAERRNGAIAAGVMAIVAACILLGFVGGMSVANALYLLSAAGLAVCCFVFTENKFGYCLVPIAVGVIAGLVGALTNIIYMIRYNISISHFFMGTISQLVYAAGFAVVILYFMGVFQDVTITFIAAGVAGALGLLFFFFTRTSWNPSYVFLLLSMCFLANAADKGEVDYSAQTQTSRISFAGGTGEDSMGIKEKEAYILSGSMGINPSIFGSMDDNNNLIQSRITEEKNIALCVVFSLITCGIYGVYWVYTICKKIKALSGDNSGVAGEVICILIVPFYAIFWAYTREEKLRQAGLLRGFRFEDNRLLYTVLTVFGFFIVTEILIQNDLNKTAREIRLGHDMSCRTNIAAAEAGYSYVPSGQQQYAQSNSQQYTQNIYQSASNNQQQTNPINSDEATYMAAQREYQQESNSAQETSGRVSLKKNTEDSSINSTSQANDGRTRELLKQLAELRDNGLLTDDEFNEKKRDLLSRM